MAPADSAASRSWSRCLRLSLAFDAGASRLAEGFLLGGVFGAELLGAVPGRVAQAGIIEQGALVGRRRRRLKRARRLLQLVVLGQFLGVLRIGGVGRELRVRQDRAAQREVVAAFQLHAGGQQGGVPVLGAVPDPARPPLSSSRTTPASPAALTIRGAGAAGCGAPSAVSSWRAAPSAWAASSRYIGSILPCGAASLVHRTAAGSVSRSSARLSARLVHIAAGAGLRRVPVTGRVAA